jgi:amino acid transporter
MKENIIRVGIYLVGCFLLLMMTGIFLPALISSNSLPLIIIILMVMIMAFSFFLFCVGAKQVLSINKKKKRKK